MSRPDKIDAIAAMLGASLGAVISCLNFVYSNEYMVTIGPMLVIVCLAYLVFRRKLLAHASEAHGRHSLVLVINIIFCLSFAGSIYSLSTAIQYRPPIYFILTSVAASMIALNILYCSRKGTIYLILFEILLLSLSVRAGALWVLPSTIGIDAWAHTEYVRDFVDFGHIETTYRTTTYLSYPIMHLNSGAMNTIMGVDYKAAMFLGASLPLILSTLFVFLIGRSVANTKVGLLAALLINLADFHLQWGIQIIAMTLGIALFTIIVYLLVGLSRHRTIAASLTILLLFELIITHTVSAFLMFCFLMLFLIGIYAYRFLDRQRGPSERTIVTPMLVVMFGVAVLAYWMYAAYPGESSFFEAVANGLRDSLLTKASLLDRPSPPTAEYGYLNPILHIAGFVMLYACGALGCLLWLSRENQNKTRIALIAALVLLSAIALIFPAFGIRNIMPYRWFAFIYVILSIVAAVAILTVIHHVGSHRLRIIILAFVVFVTSFFMITNRMSNIDSPLYASELTQKLGLTSSEMVAAERLINVYDGKILNDLTCITLMGIQLKMPNSSSQDLLSEAALNSGMVIWRDVMATRPVGVSGTTVVLGEAFRQKLENSHHLIYSNNEVKAFLPTGS